MKNPIKNGKEVFAVLSMATVMSISMSVKVDAASNSAINEDTKDVVMAAAQNMDRSSTTNDGVDNSGSKEATAKLEDNKEALAEGTKARDTGSSEVSEEVSLVESDEGSTGKEKKETAPVEEDKSQAKSLTEDAGTEVEELEVREGNTPPAQGAGETPDQEAENSGTQKEDDKNLQKATDPNYGKDEGKIKDYDGSERYKETDLQPGDTNQEFNKTDEKVKKDGFKFEFKNPSGTSPSKTEYGYQITIDKKTGQRTYTKIYVTDSGLIPVDPGEKPMVGQGDKLTPESPDITYKPDENTEITASRSQRNMNYEASEETLKHINNKDNSSTSFGMKDNYTQDNPRVKFFGGSFALGYKVNPWPNENDKLEQLKLNGQYDKKVFVQGQDIDTGIKVDNIDENAKERLVGQVYNPITGDIVPGASAYIADDGNIHIKMPEGALKKDDESGKTVINEGSIFNTPDYKALQNLDVKFFARPRTAEEFKKIAETPDEFGEKGTYTGSEAGTADINHKGKNVKIDKQGIDRYDHYNLIGGFKLNLDDTRYYDQRFEDGHKEDTSKKTYSKVKPGEEFKVGIVEPDNPGEIDKSAEEMNEAEKNGEASGRLILDFINKENEGKAEKDKWKVSVASDDISEFTITPPESAKAGDFVAIPVEYTYTNGSKDVHWFHFVVQDPVNNQPEYHVQIDFPSAEQKSQAQVPENEKKLSPKSYSIVEGTEFKDDKGNEWDVTINETTGEVTAKPKDPSKFDGGEKLQVPVIAHYEDPTDPGKDITEKATAEFVIKEKANMTARYNAKAGKAGDKISSDVILNQTDQYNRRPGKYSLESDTYVDDKGNTWNVTIDETTGKVTATVPNAEEGKSIDGSLLNVPVTAHYYEGDKEVGTRQTEVQFVGSGTKGTHKYKEELPFEVEVKKDPSLKKGEWKYATDEAGNELKGEKGEQEKTLTIVNSKVTETSDPTVTKQAKKAVILVGEGTNDGTHEIKEKKELPFETRIEYDENLEAGQREETGGTPGEQERTNTLVIKDGKVEETKEGEFKTTKKPVDKVIKIGIKPIVKEVEKPFETEYIYDENVEMGKEEEVTPGEKGKVTITTSYDKDQNKLVTKEETKDPVKRVVKVGIKPVVNTEEIPHDTEYEHDPNLEAGKVEKISDGTKGSVTITTTFNKETGKLETKVTRTEPTPAKYKYGSKTKGKVTVATDIPFEVEIIKDPEMEAGKTETVQEGELGEKETTITVENSKEVSREEKVIKDPVKKIVKVGTKCVCEIPPVDPEDSEKPVDPTNPSNPEDPKDPDKDPGKEDSKDPDKEDSKKPGNNTPSNPRDEEPGKDKSNKPSEPGKNTPNKPGENTPSEPGKNTPNKPGENPSEDPKNTPQESPEKPKLEKENELKLSETEKVKEAEKAKEADEEIETEEAKVLNQVKKEEDEEASRVGNEAGKANLAGVDKAPKTGDAGLMAETASAGLASGLLLLLGRFKRKKEDEE